MSLTAVTATARFCRSCSKLSPFHGNPFRLSAFSTSSKKCKDEDEIKSLKSNPYFGKYSEKISELQKTTPEELARRIAGIRNPKPAGVKEASSDKLTLSSPFTKKKYLNDILKIPLLEDKSEQEITEIWLKHHMSVQDKVAVVLSVEVYNLILETSSKHPTFLLPLPRPHGYEYFVSQFCGDEFHLTPLINFQAFKENAPECLLLTHFTELSKEKGIVLMRGEFNSDVLSVTEAMCLTNQIHRYYGEEDARRVKLLERFTHVPSEFHHMDLIVELERMAM
ncbi:ATP synthase mitochondrial F1 complex assembly factor 1 [Frankliniella fusca]|uniref:ATP synthase mitochondrial F1 complex assembly factor 1 n=1 Tax=Frankliniella fusca TaxID=407009 RepID=A0AAE1H2V2_9NEOP|nr:ATP synthase mitochondrial F1 complex assembly factor 1 [Frankliniella fusca]